MNVLPHLLMYPASSLTEICVMSGFCSERVQSHGLHQPTQALRLRRTYYKLSIPIVVGFNHHQEGTEYNSTVLFQDPLEKRLESSIQLDYHMPQEQLMDSRYITKTDAHTPIRFQC